MATPRDVITGMEILIELCGSDSQMGGADHNIIIGPDDENLNDEQRKRLTKAGWHKSTEYYCWCRFV